MPLPSAPQKSKSRNEILIKGLTIALIGIIILLAPVLKPESGIGQLGCECDFGRQIVCQRRFGVCGCAATQSQFCLRLVTDSGFGF